MNPNTDTSHAAIVSRPEHTRVDGLPAPYFHLEAIESQQIAALLRGSTRNPHLCISKGQLKHVCEQLQARNVVLQARNLAIAELVESVAGLIADLVGTLQDIKDQATDFHGAAHSMQTQAEAMLNDERLAEWTREASVLIVRAELAKTLGGD